MANRSKKVVLSARVDPYLKAALELLAASKNEKIVKTLEMFIENGLNDYYVKNPFKDDEPTKTPFINVFTAIWVDDEVRYKLRAAMIGPHLAGETLWRQGLVVTTYDYFKGKEPLYGDLNGLGEKWGYKPDREYFLNFQLIRDEWPLIEEYVTFLENNKPFEPDYDDYKKMRNSANVKSAPLQPL